MALFALVWFTWQATIPHEGAADSKTLKKIVDHYSRNETQLQQTIEERDARIQTLSSALNRIQKEAKAGDQQSKTALNEARSSGDTDKLQAALISVADQQEAHIEAGTADYIQLCREIAEIAFLRGDIDEAKKRLEVILKIEPDDLDAINRMGGIHLLRGELNSAEQAYLRMGELADEDLTAKAASYGNLGLIYRKFGDLTQAEKLHRKAIEIYEKLGALEGLSRQYGNLGLIHQTRGELREAEILHKKALEINKKTHRHIGLASEYGNLGLIYRKRGDLDNAEEMHKKSLEIDTKLGRLEGIVNSYGNLGLIYQERGDLDQAETMYQKSLEIENRLGRQEGIANAYGNLGVINHSRNNLGKAEEMFQRSLSINKNIGRLESQANQYCNLGRIASISGDSVKALELWTNALDLYKQIGVPHKVERVQRWIDSSPNENAE